MKLTKLGYIGAHVLYRGIDGHLYNAKGEPVDEGLAAQVTPQPTREKTDANPRTEATDQQAPESAGEGEPGSEPASA